MRAAIYLRAGNAGEAFADEAQSSKLSEFVHRQGWTLVKVYCEAATGFAVQQQQRAAMLADATCGRFDVVVFWSLDQFSRLGALATLRLLVQLSDLGVSFRSFTESTIDTCGASGGLVLSILASLWRQESILQSERTKAGLRRQKQTKKPGPTGQTGPGRPSAKIDIDKARAMRAARMPYSAIAQALGAAPSTIYRLLARP
jgi:DNA invertase Pin-like site-specific DNA recombinase